MAGVTTKVCCISSLEEASLAVDLGARALGLVGPMPSGPGVIDEDLARDIAAAAPPGIETFLLTSETTGHTIADQVERCGSTTVQIVRHIDVIEYEVLRERLPDVRRVQVIHVEDDSAVIEMKRYEPHVDAFLLDSGRPSAPTAELGGTGRVHDWRISAAIVRAARRPVYLAGGLTPENVAEAIRQVRPYGVDLCSGVRTNGMLDAGKLERFMAAVQQAGSGVSTG